ncbi:MAG: hypothetical protein ACR2NP_13325 [Pirellulaceae bacterium]
MNCEQFENRAQQLLDSRATLHLDLSLQQHARECSDCRHALAIYDCFTSLSSDGQSQTGSISLAADKSTIRPWQRRQSRTVRNRFMVAAAALLMVSLTLITRTVTAPSTAHFASMPDLNLASVSSSVDFSGLWAIQEQLPQVPAVDITAISRIDLMTLMPHKPALVVRNLPATIETIEPIYRYSTEFPMLNQWSTGINYTLGLIQSTLSGNEETGAEQPANEFGHSGAMDRRHLC